MSLHVLTTRVDMIKMACVSNQRSKFLQFRVSAQEKRVIAKYAQKAGLDMTSWVKRQLFSSNVRQYFDLLEAILNQKMTREALAHLNDFLYQLNKKEFIEVVQDPPEPFENTFQGNYIAAMVEMAANQKKIKTPSWTLKYEGLEDPYFASDMQKLRLHLLISSPSPFRKRNIFVDSTVGDRI